MYLNTAALLTHAHNQHAVDNNGSQIVLLWTGLGRQEADTNEYTALLFILFSRGHMDLLPVSQMKLGAGNEATRKISGKNQAMQRVLKE